jgi:photosystem II stability/assembly factor-like uncharacterized protein
MWYKLPLVRTLMLGVAAVDENIAYLTVGTSSSIGSILKTVDGAQTWKTENVSTEAGAKGLLYLATAAANTNDAIATGIFEHYYTVSLWCAILASFN